MSIKLTPAQERALEWLPSDGAWRSGAGRAFSGAVESFLTYHGAFCEREYGSFDGRVGWQWRYRLTPAGIAFKAART